MQNLKNGDVQRTFLLHENQETCENEVIPIIRTFTNAHACFKAHVFLYCQLFVYNFSITKLLKPFELLVHCHH